MNNPQNPSDQNSASNEETSPFAGLSNTELALTRTDLASDRTDLAKDRNRLAAERTLMAWIRTSLSMISFGFGIDRFFAYLKQSETGTAVNQLAEERVLGLGLIVLGVVALAGGTLNYWRVLKNLEQPRFQYDFTSDRSFAITIAIVLVFIGLASYIPLIAQDISFQQLISPDSQVVKTLISLSIFFIMLSIGTSLSVPNLINFWQQPILVGRSLLATVLIPPLLLAGIFAVLQLPESFALALIFLIAAPGPALLTRRAGLAGVRMEFAASLQTTLALLAIIIVPLILRIFVLLFPDLDLMVSSWDVARQVGLIQFLPLGLGVAASIIWQDLAEEITDLLSTIANTLFLVLTLIVLMIGLGIVPTLGLPVLVVTILITVLGLAIGHLVTIGQPLEQQAGIAIATIARNAGLAITIATFNGLVEVVPIIIGIVIVGTLVGLPYSVWMKRKLQ
ncbi:protein of unknown function DUF202 [Halothece sp. PCC 7418]|uniref:DUF202 domain-containing protein n=1 Tax=Halothece sp. (strain PCC 7418) TaxID=65093 RepID=UPI0002A0808C|nr:DUF202 domain-containing protein [Halothece sp. PCC 7418]AFZ45017.1 protein of unknown function DUF202 [Halothece sp. PCC 7418]